MATTTNYGLYITDDSSTKFIDWRKQMNGIDDSNMTKIDAALNELKDGTFDVQNNLDIAKTELESSIDDINTTLTTKANNSVSVEGTLLASGWIGESAPFTQELFITQMTADCNGTISLPNGASIEQVSAVKASRLTPIRQSDGSITISAEEKPTTDIPVVVIILG